MDEKKFKRNLMIWAVVLFLLQGIALVACIKSGEMISIVSALVALVLIFLFVNFSLKKNKVGPICGIILSILYIISFDISSILVGVLLISDCINLLKNINE